MAARPPSAARVRFIGRVPDEELPDLYRLADLFVMPSTGEGQAVSGSLGERAKHAVLWSAGFGLFRDGLQFLVMLIMVRVLEPAAYGQFALAGSIIGFVALLSFDSFVEHTLQAHSPGNIHCNPCNS